ncbi:MAG: 1,4-dihydroxy-6-naphthoate synthase, partial [Limisphaerales bacterium]
MKLTLGFSPCPNDTFLFHALTHNLIDTEGLYFEVILADVEALNLMALEGKLDFTKLSYAAFARAIDKYVLLHAGSALGHACGPMLIAKNPVKLTDVSELKIAIPGHHTTANFLLSLAFPNASNKVQLVFDEIEDAVLQGDVDAGLIIHENRFTYQSKGLHKIIDLGQWWEEQEKVPIPL